MRFIIALSLALAGCCGHPETIPPDAGTCPCDCPEGPPPAGQISDYCQDEEHEGQSCCLGGDNVGVCKNLECVREPPARVEGDGQ